MSLAHSVSWYWWANNWATLTNDLILTNNSNTTSKRGPRKPKPSHYYLNPIGVGGYYISYYIDEEAGEFDLELIIRDSERAYDELRHQVDEIEEELQSTVELGVLRETRTGKMRSHIGVTRRADIEAKESSTDCFEWMLDQGERFHEVFPERFRDIESS